MAFNYFIVKRHDFPQIPIEGQNTKLNNFWIITKNPKETIDYIKERYNKDDIYITNSYFSRSFSHYTGQKVILLTKIPKYGYKFLIKLNSMLDKNGRILPSCRYSMIFSNLVTLIIISDKDLNYIKDSFLRYNKDKELEARTLVNSLEKKLTIGYWD